MPLDELGPRIDPHELVPGIVPLPRDEAGTIVGEILWVDRYGNCQVNVDPEAIETWGPRVQLRWTRPREGVRTAVRAATYGDLQPSQVGLVVDSYGLLSVTVARGSAADTLGLEAGDEISLVPLDARRRRRHARRRRHRPRPHLPRHPPAPKAVMRPGTTIVLAALLALILGASAIQLLDLRPLGGRRVRRSHSPRVGI